MPLTVFKHDEKYTENNNNSCPHLRVTTPCCINVVATYMRFPLLAKSLPPHCDDITFQRQHAILGLAIATDMAIYTLICVIVGVIIIYAVRINSLMASAPAEAERLAGMPLTVEEILAVKERLRKHPIECERYLPA